MRDDMVHLFVPFEQGGTFYPEGIYQDKKTTDEYVEKLRETAHDSIKVIEYVPKDLLDRALRKAGVKLEDL